jgi:CheY-like chemotaxis protein
LKILVIDDDPEAQRYVHDALKAERPAWQVYLSSNGRDGIKQAKSLGPDVITLDIMMPNMDGWEVLKKLKDSPITASIPVAVVSMVDNHSLAFKLGAAAILPKPVPRQKLVETLEGLASHEQVRLQSTT